MRFGEKSMILGLVWCAGVGATAIAQPVGMQTDAGSAGLLERCLPPCACAGMAFRGDVEGGYSRAFSGVVGDFRTFEIEGLRLVIDYGRRQDTVEAHGVYMIGGDAGLMHRMSLTASIDGETWTFDSGLIAHSGRMFPAIDIALESTQRGCEKYSVALVSSPTCRADFNEDGFVDGFDYDDFVACFEGDRCPRFMNPDFTSDGFVDGFDYDAFVRAFEEGCR